MEVLSVPTINGNQFETVYNIDDFPYEKYCFAETVRRHKKTYLNISASFDIETTTIKKYNKQTETYYGDAFMYQWQFCVKDIVVFGRTWEEFCTFIDRLEYYMNLSSNRILVVYVHNLAYEFQFMKDFISIDSMFSKDKRKPMKILSGGIEFRCSYFLSNMSLIKFCENSQLCSHFKLADTYDYSKIRTPITRLTEEEQAYCYNDVRGLCQCVDTMLLEDDITTIPLTNTGYVRREYRTAMKANKRNYYEFKKTALLPHQYRLLKNVFRGGNTHASRFYANKILKNIKSKDIQSSYPACIMLDDFPIGKFTDVTLDTQEKLDMYTSKYCVAMEVTFYNLKTTNPFPYLDISHCKERSNIVNDNGRILSADMVTTFLTEIDLEIVRSMYTFDGLEVHKAMYARKGKLPNELREKCMHFYKLKTELKNVEGKEYEYMKSKNRINATFGMMVTDILHDEIEYMIDEHEWKLIKNEDAKKALDDFYNSRNNFLSYQWGVWVTANARKRLQRALNIVGMDGVYIDTDSVKYRNHKKYEKALDEINRELIFECNECEFDSYAVKDGKKYYLGVWDDDGFYSEFKTLGAKKYCFVDSKNGKFSITVSGMSKKKGAEAVGNIHNFNIGKTYSDIGRTTSWYNEHAPHEITVEGCTFTTASNIGILDTTYTLGITNEYWEVLNSACVS